MTWWILVALAPFLIGGFTEWLKFKEKQLKLGNTADSLSDELHAMTSQMDELRTVNDRLNERVKNLETIVTTQAWDEVVDSSKQIDPAPRLELPEDEVTEDEERARKLARRLGR